MATLKIPELTNDATINVALDTISKKCREDCRGGC
jgi:hypothetical protein